ncbi:hypothetical protein R1sor_005806 [Riccia sorocarpa]|uniref:J domain-containing protein n=1 Tax=Riccia sorocarpa TaxID=122646 RepID=A0ABD3HPG5_9MARC
MARPLLGYALLFLIIVGAEAKDPYKVLGVDKNASQQEIKKAFHKLSLKYHPDKNPAKSAQAKMAEISNAYEILSDEEKRRNYDLTGDESGRAPPEYGSAGGGFPGGFSYQNGRPGGGSHRTFHHNFQSGPDTGQNQQFWSFKTNQQQGHASQEEDEASQGWSGFGFPFDFGSGGGIFDSIFGSAGKFARESFGGFGGSDSSFGKPRQRASVELHKAIAQLDSSAFSERVSGGERDVWLVFFFHPANAPKLDDKISTVNTVTEELSGIIEVGAVNCQVQTKLCRDHAPSALQSNFPVVSIYTSPDRSTPYQFTGTWTEKAVKDFVVRSIPNFSTRVDSQKVIQLQKKMQDIPQAVLFTKKKDTPAIWRALSGLFEKRIKFYDVHVDSQMDTGIREHFGVKSYPAVVGMLGNGEDFLTASDKIFSETGKNMMKQLKKFLEDLEKKSKAAGVGMRGSGSEGGIPFLTKGNAAVVCGSNTPLCIIAVAESKDAQEKARRMLTELSHKTLIRRGFSYESKVPAVSYSILDASKQSKFLRPFKGGAVSGSGIALIAYKPRKGKYTVRTGTLTLDEVEAFVGGVLGGDVTLQALSGDPVLS